MKFEGWTRKLVKELKACGFKMEPANATSHHKFNYHGNEMIFPEFINVPIKVKNSSRLNTVDSIKKQFKKFNAPEKYMKRINKISMGLITAEAGDGIEELEDKLMTALRSRDAIASAELAAKIQELAHEQKLTPYPIKSISVYKTEQAAQKRRDDTKRTINNLLETFFKAAIDAFISENGPIEVSTDPYPDQPNHFDLTKGKAAEYGFSITSVHRYGSHEPFDVRGVLTGELATTLANYQTGAHFQITLDDEYNEDLATYYDSNDFRAFKLDHSPYDQKALDAVLDEVTKQAFIFKLQGAIC